MQRTMPTIGWVWGGGQEWAEVTSAPGEPGIRVDSPAWMTWLEAETTTRFAYGVVDPHHGYIASFVTVRKERRQRGGRYWVAYQRRNGQLAKVYLGGSGAVTSARLQAMVEQFQRKEEDTAKE